MGTPIAASGRYGQATLRRSMLLNVGLAIVLGLPVLLLLSALFGSDAFTAARSGGALAAPSVRHWMGTDPTGLDVLSGVLSGVGYAAVVIVPALLLALLIGVPLGLACGLWGGVAESTVLRICQAVGIFPPVLLALALVAARGPSLLHMAVVLGLLEVAVCTRLVAGEVRALHAQGFIEGAVAAGNTLARLVVVHVMPGIWRQILAQAPTRAAGMLHTATLMGFLGIGVTSATLDWGSMIRIGAEPMLRGAWWASLFPGLAMVTLSIGLHLLGAGLTALLAQHQAGATTAPRLAPRDGVLPQAAR